MYTAQDLLNEKKHNEVYTIDEDASVIKATRAMNQWRIGALVVVRDDRPVGIVSERDLLRRVISMELDPAVTPVSSVMTRRVIRCDSETDLDRVREIMEHWHVRHLPVEDPAEGLCGMISMRDLNTWQIQQDGVQISYLTQYVYGLC